MSVNRETGQPTNRLGLPLGGMARSILPLFRLLAALQERNVRRQAPARGARHAGDCLIAMPCDLSRIYFLTGQSPEHVGTRPQHRALRRPPDLPAAM
ncbi:hypothetical protein [Pseudooceanicola marinus]|uniref:hypothetical protein n=1 Tax=Pseudooceanicola marinus TaxID=396013 RepID=UPI000A270EA0|nr:hypothetical protein [Pseudooceanicola marinus]PJE26199.1 hypothetical protein CVM50_20230 [Pseudooceanicola marinus]